MKVHPKSEGHGTFIKMYANGTISALAFTLTVVLCHIALTIVTADNGYTWENYIAWVPCLFIPLFVFICDKILSLIASFQANKHVYNDGGSTSPSTKNWLSIQNRHKLILGQSDYNYDMMRRQRTVVPHDAYSTYDIQLRNTATYNQIVVSNVNLIMSSPDLNASKKYHTYSNSKGIRPDAPLPVSWISNDINNKNDDQDGTMKRQTKVKSFFQKICKNYFTYEICIRPGFTIFRILYQLTWFVVWCHGTYYWVRSIDQRDMKTDETRFYKVWQGSWDMNYLYDPSRQLPGSLNFTYFFHEVFIWIFEIDLICRFWIYARSTKSLKNKTFFWTEFAMMSPCLLLAYFGMRIFGHNTYGVSCEQYYLQYFGWLRAVSLFHNTNDLKNVNVRNPKANALCEILISIAQLVFSLGSFMFVIDGVRHPDFDGTINPADNDTVFEFQYFAVMVLIGTTITIGYGDYHPESLVAKSTFILLIGLSWALIPNRLAHLLNLHEREETIIGALPAVSRDSQTKAADCRSAKIISRRLQHDTKCGSTNDSIHCAIQLKKMKSIVDENISTLALKKNVLVVAGNLVPSKLEVFVTELATNWRNDSLLHFPYDSEIRFGDNDTLCKVLHASNEKRRQTLHIVYLTSYSPILFEELIPLMYAEFDVNLSVLWEHFLVDNEDPDCVHLEDRKEYYGASGSLRSSVDRRFTPRASALILEAESVYLLPSFSADDASAERKDELVLRLTESVKHIRGSLQDVTAAFHLTKSRDRISGLSNSVSISSTVQSLLTASVLRHSGLHSLFGLICSHASFTTLNIESIINPVEDIDGSVPSNDFLPIKDATKRNKLIQEHNDLLTDCLMMAGQQMLQVLCLLPNKLHGTPWLQFVHVMKQYFDICALFLVVWDHDGEEGYVMPSKDFRMGASRIEGKRIRGVLVLCKDESIKSFYRVFLHVHDSAITSNYFSRDTESSEPKTARTPHMIESNQSFDDDSDDGRIRTYFTKKLMKANTPSRCNEEERVANEVMTCLSDDGVQFPHKADLSKRIYGGAPDGEPLLSNTGSLTEMIYEGNEGSKTKLFPVHYIGKSMVNIQFNEMISLTIGKSRFNSGSFDGDDRSMFDFHHELYPQAFEKCLGARKADRAVHFLKWPQDIDFFLKSITHAAIAYKSSYDDPRSKRKIKYDDDGRVDRKFVLRVVMLTDNIPRGLFSAILKAYVHPSVSIQIIAITGDWTDKHDLTWAGAATSSSIGLQCTSPAFPTIHNDDLWKYIKNNLTETDDGVSFMSDASSISDDEGEPITVIPIEAITTDLYNCPINATNQKDEMFFDETVLRSCLLINEIHEHGINTYKGGSFAVQLDYVPNGYLSSTIKEPPLNQDSGAIQAVMEGKCLTVEMLYGMCVKSTSLSSLPDISRLTEYINMHNMYDIVPLSDNWAGQPYQVLWNHFREQGKIIMALHLYSFDQSYIERYLHCESTQNEDGSHPLDNIPSDCYPQYTWAVSPPNHFMIPNFPRSRSSKFPLGYVVYFAKSKITHAPQKSNTGANPVLEAAEDIKAFDISASCSY